MRLILAYLVSRLKTAPATDLGGTDHHLSNLRAGVTYDYSCSPTRDRDPGPRVPARQKDSELSESRLAHMACRCLGFGYTCSQLMSDVKTRHDVSLAHHLEQGKSWLVQSANGVNTAALSYAALELRFAVERLAVHYWSTLLERPFEEKEVHDIRSFRALESHLYKLGGNQLQIDRHFRLIAILNDMLQLPVSLVTPKVSALRRAWQDCSELCHIAWPLLSCSAAEVGASAFKTLTDTAQLLTDYVQSASWPVTTEAFGDLRTRFIGGTATEEDVRSELKRLGVYATFTPPNGIAEFVGTAVPPEVASANAD